MSITAIEAVHMGQWHQYGIVALCVTLAHPAKFGVISDAELDMARSKWMAQAMTDGDYYAYRAWEEIYTAWDETRFHTDAREIVLNTARKIQLLFGNEAIEDGPASATPTIYDAYGNPVSAQGELMR